MKIMCTGFLIVLLLAAGGGHSSADATALPTLELTVDAASGTLGDAALPSRGDVARIDVQALLSGTQTDGRVEVLDLGAPQGRRDLMPVPF